MRSAFAGLAAEIVERQVKAAFLAAPAAASEWGRPRDPGGLVADYLMRNALAGGARDEIRGDCVSACVLRLGNSGPASIQTRRCGFIGRAGLEATPCLHSSQFSRRVSRASWTRMATSKATNFARSTAGS